MSLSVVGQHIHCDGEGCAAVTDAPVALRPQRMQGGCKSLAAAGWLFLLRQGVCRHYCPACARRYLAQAIEAEPDRNHLEAVVGNDGSLAHTAAKQQ